jgi:hypothetical protein
MTQITHPMTYFSGKGRENTQQVLSLARERLHALGIKKVLVATTSGETGALAASRLSACEVIAVTHSTGFSAPNVQELQMEFTSVIESAGGKILTAQHALGGVNRAVRRKLNTFQLDEIIAHTLRIFGQGMKVAFEITLMAADAGLVRTDELVLCIAGSGRGADTAVILKPANAQDFFDLQLIEIICLPSPMHPELNPE